ncbi:MAG TPA: hypothetical protein VG223_06010 [Solirubrobacteraceae bacterium]|nr:hypothetical protein [Solirubrobacteraceae bacterium]
MAAAAVAVPGANAGSLAGRYSAGQRRAGALSARIADEENRIQGFEGTLGALAGRLRLLQRTIGSQQQVLGAVRVELATDHLRLAEMQRDYARDQRILAAQLLQRYESPPPTVLDVIVDAHGFDNLLNGLSDLTAIARRDVQATARVKTTRATLAAEAERLYRADAGKLRQEAALISERDQIAQLKLSIVERELAVAHAHNQDTARLRALQGTLSVEGRRLTAQAIAAEVAAYKTGGVAPAGCVNTAFVAHDGPFGFFQAPGTDYTVNQEPVIAARLDALGRALDLHLVGISGYRTPQHSVEVGGFADDPHTHGEASDTLGVEGVPEPTLERFCLTRPFAGPREADHIQEL